MTLRLIRLLWAAPLLASLAAAALGAFSPVAGAPASGPIYVLPTSGVVDNVMAGYLAEAVRRAERDGSPAVVIMLNTPGGSLDATQKIVSTLLTSPVPTIVWVAPAGGRAASAGTFITLAANLAFMAPGTNIGAASPVGGGGEDIVGTLGEKVKNDAIANIRSIAEARGRNVDWAVATVAQARSSPATEAVSVGAVDGLADTLEAVRAQAEGRTVKLPGGEVTLSLAGARFADLAMNPFQSILHLLSDPNIAFILFTIGFYGLLFELQNPNFVTGILGALAIILAFVGFGSLPLNFAGVLLIGLAVVLFALEITVTSHGLLTVGGLVTFVLGAFALYTEPGTPTAPDVSVALPLVATMAVVTAAFMLLALTTVVRSRRGSLALASLYGAGGTGVVPAGSAGVARTALAPSGVIYAVGEEWTARSSDGRPIEPGTALKVVRQEGLTLVVEPAAEASNP